MKICPLCGEAIEAPFDSCWQCSKPDASAERPARHESKEASPGFWTYWRRGWFVLLWAVVMGLSIRMTATLMSRFQDQYHDPFVRSAFAVTALAFVFVALPAFAYWLFALFFSHESWPIGRKRQR